MMADNQEINPLPSSQQLVNKDGTPTLFFMRWAQERSININDNITEEQAEAMFAARHVVAGVGLDGGGSLATDVTVDLANTLVTPGTYGDGTHVPQITIDQQGRISDAVEVPISGGGGGGSMFAWVTFTTSGGVATIVAEKNIASITEFAPGLYHIVFTAAAPDTAYVVWGAGRFSPAADGTTPVMGSWRNAPQLTTGFDGLCTANNGVGGNDPDIATFFIAYPADLYP